MKVKCIIEHGKASSLFWKGQFIDTNREIELEVGDILRLSRLYSVKTVLPYTAYNPSSWKEKKYCFYGDADSTSGFGNCTVNLLKQSVKNGYDVRWIGRSNNAPEVIHLSTKDIPLDAGLVYHEQPLSRWLESPFEKQLAIVPFETTKIPPSWLPKLNSLTSVMVPCAQNVQMMIDSGVKVPVELIHWGVDFDQFPLLERNNSQFTFGHMGALSIRKGTDLVIAAFQKAFPINRFPDVRLLCKTSYSIFTFPVNRDPRIKVSLGQFDKKELLNDFFKKVDCLVYPTRGEGAGLVIPEAAATGMPAIVTGWSGPLDYATEDSAWFLDYSMISAKNFTEQVYKEDCGEWAEPNIDDLVEKMRYAYEHPTEVKQKGLNGATWVRMNRTWDQGFKKYEAVLNKYL